MATIGRKAAVADFGWLRLRGSLAWWVWGLAHIYFLIGTRNRMAVALSWLWSHAMGQKSARLITEPVHSRSSAEPAPRLHAAE
ncbi:hypothetical protein [Mangrovicoccus ximenensis]|uniref:hypothetical protein n=1 Tax=Mangrovicoccus ximenensis TaxID=1911570 RepID=UPI0038B336B6